MRCGVSLDRGLSFNFRAMMFDELPGHARLWVHTADRALTDAEQQDLVGELNRFLEGWSAHGASLAAAGTMMYDRVLLVGLDEAQAGATGCSIDKLVGFLRAHGERVGLDWFDRHQVVWRQPEGLDWQGTRTPEFWAMRKAGVVHAATEVVDPLAGRVQDAKSSQGWLVKNFDESWHAAMWS
jgi:hypothetical protein